VKYRLGEERINEIILLLSEKILKLSPEKEAKIHFLPFEASRYDKHSDCNPHYECKMDKVHYRLEYISKIKTSERIHPNNSTKISRTWKKHDHIKDKVKFEIRRIKKKIMKLYSLLNFIAYKLVVLKKIIKRGSKQKII
jgi:hypothetical protein